MADSPFRISCGLIEKMVRALLAWQNPVYGTLAYLKEPSLLKY